MLLQDRFFLIKSKANRLALGGLFSFKKYSPRVLLEPFCSWFMLLKMTSAADRSQFDAIGSASFIASKIIIRVSWLGLEVISFHASAAFMLPCPSGPTDNIFSIESLRAIAERVSLHSTKRSSGPLAL